MMKTSKELILDYLKQETAKGNGELDTQTVAGSLGMQRTNVSALLNTLVSEGKIIKTKTRPVYYSLPLESIESDCFSKMIGYNESLSGAIQLAKAAILYPSRSLNTLIVGNPGTGKSYLASLMFDFAKRQGAIGMDAQFYKINCRHFVNDQQKLNDLLFAHSADDGSENYFDLAENSILFIDNIDVLDGPGLARINSYLETGLFHYQHDIEAVKKNVTVIIAIDRNVSTEILQTLESKIPIHIELPDLKAKSFHERFELISHFFHEETLNTKFNIAITPDVLRALMLADNPLNLKFLFATIKVAVANAYLRCYDSSVDTIQVVLDDLEKSVSDCLMNYKIHQEAIQRSIPESFDYFYSKEGEKQNYDLAGKDFYDYLNHKIAVLQDKGMDKAAIDTVLSSEIKELIHSYQQDIRKAELDFDQLSKVVDPAIIEMVSVFIRECSQTLNIDYPNSVLYGLCLHINAMAKSTREIKYLSNDKIQEVKLNHPVQYQLAQRFSLQLANFLKKPIPESESVMLTMFLIYDEETSPLGAPQILIAMHGDKTASSLAEVINTLVKANNTFAYDMALQKDSESAYHELKELILGIDQGQGVIVMYDMGSIKTVLDRIISEVSIEIRLVYIPVTLIGIEASRKAAMQPDIDTVYHSLLSNMKRDMNAHNIQSAVITLCHTGEGGAIEIKEYLQNRFSNDMKIYALAITDRRKLVKEVQYIKKYYDVKAFIGTYDPKLFGIPFIPVSRVFEDKDFNLDYLAWGSPLTEDVDFDQMLDYLHDETMIDKEKLKEALPYCLEKLDERYGLNIDQKVGLFLHIGALISRVLNHGHLQANKHTDYYMKQKKEDVRIVKEALKKIEKNFNIIVPDDEVVTGQLSIK